MAMILGSLAIGPVLDNYGRKSGLIVALLLAFFGWTVLSAGGWLVGGRLLTGFSAGLSSAPVSVLIAEISAPRLRSIVTTFKHAAFSLGILGMYSLGLLFKERWRGAAVCSAVTSCCCLLGVYFWVPETRSSSSEGKAAYRSFFKALPRRSDVAKPFALMAGLSALKQLSGTTVVLSYAVQMLRAGGLEEAGIGAVYLGAVRLSASLVAAPLAAKFGRRALASYGGYFSSLVLLLLAGGATSSLLSLLVFVFMSALASSAIQALVGEVFLPDFRAVSTGLTTTTTYASAFAALHSHPWLVSKLGFQRLLGLYATISVISTLVSICFLRDNVHSKREQEAAETKADAEATVPLQEEAANGDLEAVKA